MPTPRSQLDRFVSALHRRLVLVRAVETTALGAAGGCVAGALLIPVLYLRSVPALPPALWALLVGAATGLLWGLTRRPGRLHAAAEADRQLRLSDLLATALTVNAGPRDSDRDPAARAWLGAVMSMADAACARHTPSEVILHRLHARAWGGIAVAAGLVLTVAVLTTPDPAARAATAATPVRSELSRGQQSNPTEPEAGPGLPNPSRSQGTGPQRDPEAASIAITKGPDDPTDEVSANPASPATRSTSASTTTGQGGGTARSPTPAPRNPQSPQTAASTRGNPPSPGGDPANGSGPATTRPTPGASPGTAGGATPPTAPTPPWQSPTWPADARAAQEAIDAGRVPDTRRDLVRDYFDRR